MTRSLIQSGRPRLLVNYGLILGLRESENLGWFRVAREYTKRTGQYISKQTCKRRYEEIKVVKSNTDAHSQKIKLPRSPPRTDTYAPTILPDC